jgi:hypothetical protein
MPESTITSPCAQSRVNSNPLTMGDPMPESGTSDLASGVEVHYPNVTQQPVVCHTDSLPSRSRLTSYYQPAYGCQSGCKRALFVGRGQLFSSAKHYVVPEVC